MFSGSYTLSLVHFSFIFYVEVSRLSANRKHGIVSEKEGIFPSPSLLSCSTSSYCLHTSLSSSLGLHGCLSTLGIRVWPVAWSSWELVSLAASQILSLTWYPNWWTEKLRNLWDSFPNSDLLLGSVQGLWPSVPLHLFSLWGQDFTSLSLVYIEWDSIPTCAF